MKQKFNAIDEKQNLSMKENKDYNTYINNCEPYKLISTNSVCIIKEKRYKMKKALIVISMIISFIISTVSAEGIATKFEVVPVIDGEEVSVSVKYTDNTEMCGGSLNFVFDKANLELIDVIEGEAIKNTTHFINKEYTENTVRVNWASTTPLVPTGELFVVNLKLTGSDFDKNSISIEKLKTADGDGEKIVSEYEIIYDNEEEDTTGTNTSTNNPPSSGGRPSSGSSVNDKEEIEKEETKKEEVVPKLSFVDVKETDWYYEAVKFAFEKGITSGVSETAYAPNNKVTRGQFITMLCRAYGIKEMTGDNFADCGDTWYTGYLAAAKQLGISNGIGDNKFAPEKEVSREEMVTLIYNYLKSVGEVSDEQNDISFEDGDTISDWAKSGVAFASSKGYVTGKGNNLFDPSGDATRAELAQIFFNMFK